jgi:hypothetical protein
MRKKVAIGLGLVFVVLAVTVLVCDRMGPAEPPLRVGMTADEVVDLLGLGIGGGNTLNSSEIDFVEDADWQGNRK